MTAYASSFDISLRPIRNGGAEVYAIEVEQTVNGVAPADGAPFSLTAPIVYAAVTKVADRIQSLDARDASGPISFKVEDDKAAAGGFPYYRHWRAERAVAFPLTVKYTALVQPAGSPGGPAFGIRPSGGGVSGSGGGFLLLPENGGTDVSHLSWKLDNLAPNSVGVTTFGEGNIEVAGEPEKLNQAWMMAGPANRYSFKGHSRFDAYWLGEPAFDAQEEMEWTAKAYDYLGQSFGYLNPPPDFRVFMRTLDTPPFGGGTALGNSFMLSMSKGSQRDQNILRETFFHEMSHQWVGGIEGDNGVIAWFAEGLNVYYTTVLPLRAGLISVDQYGETLNRQAKDYYESPARNWSAEKIAHVGFADEKIRHTPYVRGALYFADLDSKIRHKSGGKRDLDTFLHPMFVARQKGERFDTQVWESMLSKELGAQAVTDFRSALLEGTTTLAPASDSFGPCFKREGTKDSYQWKRVSVKPDHKCRYWGASPKSQPPVKAETQLPVVIHHVGTFNGRKVGYTATVESVDVPNAKGKPGARVVSFAYVVDKTADVSKRPVLFAFNGGPIVASSFLHLGVLGPKRLAIPEDLKADPSTYKIVDNEYSPLDTFDIVLFDPASTGFSRVLPGTSAQSYFSVRADGQQTTAFISEWLSRHGRLASPVYILGESYGTNRAVETAGQLAELPKPILLSGVVLLGQAVNIIEYVQRPQNIVSYVVSLPTLASIAWYHQKVDRHGKSLEQFVDEARKFAQTDYLTALIKGNAIETDERDRVASRLEALSGIPATYYSSHALRISKEQFRGELLKDQKLLLGRSDGRYTASMTDKGLGPDPFEIVQNAYQKAFPVYLRDELKISNPEKYLFDSPVKSLDAWDWGYSSPFATWSYGDRLNKVFETNPKFRVLVGNGYYDTQTTVGAAELVVRQAGWPEDRTTLEWYEGGHMAYSTAKGIQKITQDLRAFVK